MFEFFEVGNEFDIARLFAAECHAWCRFTRSVVASGSMVAVMRRKVDMVASSCGREDCETCLGVVPTA